MPIRREWIGSAAAGHLLLFLAAAVLLVGVITAPVRAEGARLVVPETLPGIHVIDGPAVLTFLERGDVLIVDGRKPSDFNFATIPTAVNCPITSGRAVMNSAEVETTKADFEACDPVANAERAADIVVFCNGIHCWRSCKGAVALQRMGFAKVHWYRTGMNDWKAKGFPME